MDSSKYTFDAEVLKCLLYGYAHAKRELDAANGANHRNRTPASALIAENLRLLAAEFMLLRYVLMADALEAFDNVRQRYEAHVLRAEDAGLTSEEIVSILDAQRALNEGFMNLAADSSGGQPRPSAAPRGAIVQFPQGPRGKSDSGRAKTPASASPSAGPGQSDQVVSTPLDPTDRRRQ
jgi:hypothetical protein